MINKETFDFIKTHINDDIRSLALKKHNGNIDIKTALQQIEGRQLAKHKLPSWAIMEDLIFPPKLSMEQCSSEHTALYKQNLVKRILDEHNIHNASLTDLTGGFGIDFSFLAPLFSKAVYREQQRHLCEIARHNFKMLKLNNTSIIEGNSTENTEDWECCDCIFIDPARRSQSGKKTIAIEDCEPDICILQNKIREKSLFCIIKLSPMLDISQALSRLDNISEIHVISVNGECKELLLVMNKVKPEQTVFYCANITPKGTNLFSFNQESEQNSKCIYTDKLKAYLYEPNASVLKAGAFKSISQEFGIEKLHPNSHLYTSDHYIENFPGRVFSIDSFCGFGKKEIKGLLEGIKQANLTIRNFPSNVAEMRKKLKIKEGGDIYLFATTLANNEHIIIKAYKNNYGV